jgi:hypothetical protein
MQKMAVDCIEDDLGNLRAGGVIEKYEMRLLMERGKERTDSVAREGHCMRCELLLLVDHLGPHLGSGLRFETWIPVNFRTASVGCSAAPSTKYRDGRVSPVYKGKLNFPSHLE